MIKINIIMSVYNSLPTLSSCLKSIFAQSYKNWQMILVDDGSNDGSELLINKIKDERVIVLRNDLNKGLAYSLNRAIDLCDAEYIARVDSDDVQLSNRLSDQINFLESNPQVDILYSSAYMKSSKKISKLNIPTSHKEISSILKKRNCILHPTVMFRNSFFKKYGSYNPTFRRAQDYELWLRALKKGAVFNGINKPLIQYETKNYAWPYKTLLRHTISRFRIFFKYQKLNSIKYLIIDVIHPYFLKLISFF